MFADCRAHAIDAKVALLRELSDIVRPAAGHVITIGRIAGQVPLFDSYSQTKTILHFVSVLQAEKQRHGNHQQRLSASKLQVAPAMQR
jgi:short-subunit dehydrogenase